MQDSPDMPIFILRDQSPCSSTPSELNYPTANLEQQLPFQSSAAPSIKYPGV